MSEQIVPQQQETPPAGRDLGLAGLPNARDLGGYRAAHGRTVRPGLLLRAESLTNAAAGDVAALISLGVGLVVDLRGEPERQILGEDPWPGEIAHLPTADVTQVVFKQMAGAGPDAEPISELEVVEVMVEMYRCFVADADTRAAFAAALRLIAEHTARGISVLFHCTAGKDRTGWLAALLLTALGADRETVFEDYLLTNRRSADGRGAVPRAKLLATLRGIVGERQPMEPLVEARAEYLQAAFDEAEARYGTIETFLREGLGVDQAALRARLLG
jgi:protein-tyrosine phosphatase